MRTFLVYLELELKKTFKILPSFLGGAVVLIVLIGTIAFSASKVLYGDTVVGRITVGVALPQEDALASKAVDMISSLDSVKSLCDFVYVSEEEGKEQLKSGQLYALMLVPESFIQGIMNGTNTPVTIILPDQAGIEAGLFTELADAGTKTLGVAQASIYAADEFCYLNGMVDSVSQVESRLNHIFMNYSLPRESYFRSHEVSASGDVTVVQYYGISAAVLLLLLLGIPASTILRPHSQVMAQKLKMIRIGRGKTVFSRIICVAFLLLLALGIIAAALFAGGFLEMSWPFIIMSLVSCFTAAAMIVFAYEAGKSQIAGVMLLFLGTVVMLFAAGGFIPSVFLPDGVRALARFMPVTALTSCMKMAVTGQFHLGFAAMSLLTGAAFFAGSLAVRR